MSDRLHFAWNSKAISLCVVGAIAVFFISTAVLGVGESPKQVFRILFSSSFGSIESFSYTVFYATPLILTGLAVSIPLQAGLFNIGAEGQLTLGAIFAIASSQLFVRMGFPPALIFVASFFSAFLGGSIWGGIAGALRIYRSTHEVIGTIMLNFIAAALSNWVVLYAFKNPDTQSLETVWLPPSLRISHLWLQSTWGAPLALLVLMTVTFAIYKTWWGYRVRVCGHNASAAKVAGIKVEPTIIGTMVLGGGIAGLVGFCEIYFHSYRLIDSFSPQYGFTGIAVALISRGNPIGILASSLLFGALHKGTLDLDIETEHMTRDLSSIIQALLLMAIATQPQLEKLLQKKERK